jgi:hypothetical protein
MIMTKSLLLACCFGTFSLLAIDVRAEDEQKLTPESVQFFESKIRPVLVEHCYRCHSVDGQGVRGGLAVDHRDALLAGGESGPAIVPGNLQESTLWSAINYQDYQMPPKNKLPPAVIEDFRKWIEMGAPDPRVKAGVTVHSRVTPADIAEGKKFWSFTKPKQTNPKDSAFSSWAKTTIDKYVAERWQEKSLQPSEDVPPEVLVKRLFNDLIGLPPKSSERDAFVEAFHKNPESALNSLVDDLLRRPQFGERWGRHWLDIARYAETTGKEVEVTFPHAWRYRDYVIDSFNADKPYDKFIRQQIAGDLLPVKSDQEWTENLIATGFLALGPKSLQEQNPRQFKADLVDEQIDTTTRVILGVSVACARCHDHKFDPISQTDYYALAGIFQSTETCFGGTRSLRNRQPSNLIELPVPDLKKDDRPIPKKELAELKTQLKQLEEQYAEARRAQRQPNSDNRNSFISVAILDQAIASVTNRIKSFDEDGKPISMCMGVQDADRPRPARLLVRGEIDQPAQEVPRGFVEVLDHSNPKLPANASGRLELAEWLTSKENPLTARVMVNRIWKQLVGNAIVEETDNFGMSGPAPSHPELLDHLAIEFMQNRWSIKHMIRAIATSRVYRLSSKFDVDRFEADPDNHYFARSSVRRLDAETIRDSMLAISGQLELDRPRASVIASFGQVALGPNGPISLPPGAVSAILSKDREAGSAFRLLASGRTSSPFEAPNYHRSVYLPIARNSLPRALDVFDFAEPSLIVGERERSNTPEQSLYMLNSPFVLEQSDALARQLMKIGSDNTQRIGVAFEKVYGRKAIRQEIQSANEFFRAANSISSTTARDQKTFRTLSQFCQALFGSAEFRFID